MAGFANPAIFIIAIVNVIEVASIKYICRIFKI